MARLALTADLGDIVGFDDVGIRMPRMIRRGGGGRRQRLRRMAGETRRAEEWRLRHATFTIGEGESVAIMGGRGSGREVLLRLAAGTLIPDEGTVRRRVPIIPMIDLAKGLQRTLTYRQNIFVLGGLLGMTPEQSGRRMADIVEFAGVESVLDRYLGAATPLVRQKLAWSIAMHTEARAFAIEQTLVVGDRDFRQQCWTRVDAMRADGTTFLVSSDSLKQYRRFCDRAILLEDGAVVAQAPVAEAIALLRQSRQRSNEPEPVVEDDEDDDGGSGVYPV